MELEKKPTNAVDTIYDADLLGMSDGTENLASDSRSFPFLRIAQDLTAQAKKPTATQPNPSYIDGLDVGMFYNNLSNKVYGASVRVIPVFAYDMFTLWGKNIGDFKGNMLPSEHDNEVADGKWRLNDKRQFIRGEGENLERATLTRNFFCLLPDDLDAGIVLLSLSSLGLSHARKWLSNMDRQHMPGQPGVAAKKFLQIWKLSTVLDQRPQGNSFQLGTKAKSAIEFEGLIGTELVPIVKSALASIQAIGNFKTVKADDDVATQAAESVSPSATDEASDF